MIVSIFVQNVNHLRTSISIKYWSPSSSWLIYQRLHMTIEKGYNYLHAS